MVEFEDRTSLPFAIEQDSDGYRYSIEPFLLADFVNLPPQAKVLDVGTGCGIIPLLLLTRQPRLRITAVEIQKPLYEMAVRNVSQNGLSGAVEVLQADFTKNDTFRELFDVIVSNPPYRKINSGRINPNKVKAIARHELTLTLPLLVRNSCTLLKPGGKMVLAYPSARFDEVRVELTRWNLNLGRVRFVHGYPGTEAKIVLIEASKESITDHVVETPLTIYNIDGSYTREMRDIYVSFNYTGRSHRQREKRNGNSSR